MADAAAQPPRWVTAAWQPTSAARGSSEGLSTARIVDSAIELADEVGLAALSIRKLGERLGAGTMAAYRHVESREQLVMLMVDAALGPPASGILSARGWQQGVRRWTQEISGRYAAHPWLIDAPIAGVPVTPNRALWLEYILQTLAKTGLTLQQLLDAALLIDGHARNVAHLRREIERAAAPAEPVIWLSGLFDPVTFPMMSQVMSAGSLEDGTELETEFGLGRIIAGIQELARRE